MTEIFVFQGTAKNASKPTQEPFGEIEEKAKNEKGERKSATYTSRSGAGAGDGEGDAYADGEGSHDRDLEAGDGSNGSGNNKDQDEKKDVSSHAYAYERTGELKQAPGAPARDDAFAVVKAAKGRTRFSHVPRGACRCLPHDRLACCSLARLLPPDLLAGPYFMCPSFFQLSVLLHFFFD